jgi:hypothetical protein
MNMGLGVQYMPRGRMEATSVRRNMQKPPQITDELRTFDKLIELLGNARNGQSPYLGSDGCPLVPHWAEKRRDKRQLVGLGAKACCAGVTHIAIVADITEQELGLNRIFGLRSGRIATVELDDGRGFVGVVTWTALNTSTLRGPNSPATALDRLDTVFG